MAYAVFSSNAGIGGKLTIRVPTPEEALSRAQSMLETGSDQVMITVTATGDEFTTPESASRLRTKTLPISKVGWSRAGGFLETHCSGLAC